MRAFVIRPFGVKGGVDFEQVEAGLIAPALARLKAAGGTTQQVIEAGNIREDMFQLLLVSDLVVADISIDNANAYYELGIRHALREKRTFLIRASGMTNAVPFDLRTDRYLTYDPANPAAALDALVAGLEATIASDRQDSPVFRMLPQLREQDRGRFLPIPREFREEVEYAARWTMRGKLALLGQEAKGALWESEGLRMVAREQFGAKSFEAAAATLEDLRAIDPMDAEANLLLGTIYERLDDLPASEAALSRVVDRTDVTGEQTAEAWSLLGRNLKATWSREWRQGPLETHPQRALDSPLLMQTCEAYARAFRQDLHHYYSGLNALAMLTIAAELAAALPAAWSDRFASEDDARRKCAELEAQRRTLAGAVEFSVTSSQQKAARTAMADPWIGVSLADLAFLTGVPAGVVVRAYQDALAGQPAFISDSVRAQLGLYQALGIFVERAARVLAVLAPPSATITAPTSPRTVLFAGHQIDAPGERPRFPADREPIARAAIREALARELADAGSLEGLAGAASGGDILFHEVCADLGIPTRLHLALPIEDYIRASVAPAGGAWIPRFWAIRHRVPNAPVLSRTPALPGWLRHREPYTIWQRNNLWMLNEALASGSQHVTVLALWDGRPGRGTGGTSDMIAIAQARGARTRVLDTRALFGLADTREGAV